MIVLKIAFRNLLEHKVKTAVVGFLIAFAITFLVTGNSVMDSIKLGLRKSYAENFSGDLIVHGISEDTFSLIAMNPGGGDIPVLSDYQRIRSVVEASPDVQTVLPLVSGMASINVGEEAAGISFLWGVDFVEYQKMFPTSLTFLEGSYPSAEGSFILLGDKVHADAEKEIGHPIKVGDTLTLAGFGANGNRLREVKVAGIIKFERGGVQLDRLSILDVGTLRSLKAMTAFSSSSQDSTTGAASDGAINEDDLFGSGSMELDSLPTNNNSISHNYESILGDLSARDKYSELDTNAWNFLLVKLTDPKAYTATKASIDTNLEELQIKAEVSDWRWGAGIVAELVYTMQIFFNVIILIISIVAIIIIMNTLVISVTERIGEIGTIRAMGGSKGFIRSMIVWETLSISLVFGIIGIVLGSILISIAHKLGFASDNMFLNLLFGGPSFRPDLSLNAVLTSLLAALGIGTLASLYPTAVALKISPVKAMQQGAGD